MVPFYGVCQLNHNDEKAQFRLIESSIIFEDRYDNAGRICELNAQLYAENSLHHYHFAVYYFCDHGCSIVSSVFNGQQKDTSDSEEESANESD